MRRAGSLCRDLGTLVKCNKNQLCEYMTTEPVRLAGSQYCGIPGGNFPSNPACRAARRIQQARTRTEGNILLMRIASNLYIKMAAPGWPSSCNTGIKVASAELASPIASPAHVIRPLLWVELSRSLHVKAWSLPLSRFVYERIRLNLINPGI